MKPRRFAVSRVRPNMRPTRMKKKICNNLVFKPDNEVHKDFRRYDCAVGKRGDAHDAGYDAYMTGLVFACTSKYIEIGELLAAIEKRKEDQVKLKKDKQTLKVRVVRGKLPPVSSPKKTRTRSGVHSAGHTAS